MHSPHLEQGGSPGLGPHTPLSSPSVSGTLVLALRVEVMMGGLWSQPGELLAVTATGLSSLDAHMLAGRGCRPGVTSGCLRTDKARPELATPERSSPRSPLGWDLPKGTGWPAGLSTVGLHQALELFFLQGLHRHHRSALKDGER